MGALEHASLYNKSIQPLSARRCWCHGPIFTTQLLFISAHLPVTSRNLIHQGLFSPLIYCSEEEMAGVKDTLTACKNSLKGAFDRFIWYYEFSLMFMYLWRFMPGREWGNWMGKWRGTERSPSHSKGGSFTSTWEQGRGVINQKDVFTIPDWDYKSRCPSKKQTKRLL